MNPLLEARKPGPVADLITNLMLTPNPKGTKAMLLYEDLARERMREAERAARQHRLVRHVSAVRRWERVSAWAARRAERAADRDLV
jgi:putative heme iron utilization protein